MRRGTVLNLKNMRFLEALGKNRLVILITICFLLGVLVGSLCFENDSKIYEISEYMFNSYLNLRLDKSVISIFFKSFSFAASVLVALFLCGSSLFGVILSPLTVFFGGFFSGGFCAYMYAQFSLKGIALNAVIIIPSFIILIICLIFSACDAVKLSLIIAKLTLPTSYPINLYLDFKKYCGKYIIFILLCILSGIVDSVLSHSFLKLFDIL